MIDLCLITPTRKRWHWLREQLRATAPQMRDSDHWVILADCDMPDPETMDEAAALLGERLTFCQLSYARKHPGVGRVNMARNAGAALAPLHCGAFVELDDHDILRPDALTIFRGALDGGADYVFGDHQIQTVVVPPDGVGSLLEPGGIVRHEYKPPQYADGEAGLRDYFQGSFTRGDIDGVGPRAIRRGLWHALRGWGETSPGGDCDFAMRAEQTGAAIVHVPAVLSTVTIEPDSIMGTAREAAALQGVGDGTWR